MVVKHGKRPAALASQVALEIFQTSMVYHYPVLGSSIFIGIYIAIFIGISILG